MKTFLLTIFISVLMALSAVGQTSSAVSYIGYDSIAPGSYHINFAVYVPPAPDSLRIMMVYNLTNNTGYFYTWNTNVGLVDTVYVPGVSCNNNILIRERFNGTLYDTIFHANILVDCPVGIEEQIATEPFKIKAIYSDGFISVSPMNDDIQERKYIVTNLSGSIIPVKYESPFSCKFNAGLNEVFVIREMVSGQSIKFFVSRSN